MNSLASDTPREADAAYHRTASGMYVPEAAPQHREDEYDSAGFHILLRMQERHFWYAGRHRFLLGALKQALGQSGSTGRGGSAIDLGGGCGGWVRYLQHHAPEMFQELALADSSLRALEMAQPLLGPAVPRYQIDLLHLQWQERWDVAFLLDVLEHIPDHLKVLQQIREALRPGGLLVITAPALNLFWSYNDELARHVRRYSRQDLVTLARAAGFEVSRSRYFMFFLSPLLLLSRLGRRDVKTMARPQLLALQERTHRVPMTPINRLLQLIFSLETPLGLHCPFPCGSSVLAILRKPG